MLVNNVWYASEARALSRSKVLVYDAIGSLDVDGSGASFTSRDVTVGLQNLNDPALASQTWNSTPYLWMNLAVLSFYAVMIALFAGAGMDGSATIGLAGFALLLLALMNLFGYLIGRATKWIVLRGDAPDGSHVTCYFADGGAAGWSGILGGTRRLFEEVRRLTSASS